MDPCGLCSLRTGSPSLCHAGAAAHRPSFARVFDHISSKEHTLHLCQERPVQCTFPCCNITFPLSFTVTRPLTQSHCLSLDVMSFMQGKHNQLAVVAHADFLLHQYIRRQFLLSQMNEKIATVHAANAQKYSHVAAVNAGLAAEAAKVSSPLPPPFSSCRLFDAAHCRARRWMDQPRLKNL